VPGSKRLARKLAVTISAHVLVRQDTATSRPTRRQRDKMAELPLGYSVWRRLNINGDLPPMNTQRLFPQKDAEHVTTTLRNRRSGSIHPRSHSHPGTRHRYRVARRASATLAGENDLVDRWSRVPPGRGCRRIPPSVHLIARGVAMTARRITRFFCRRLWHRRELNQLPRSSGVPTSRPIEVVYRRQ
jgi:hypothetical protein